MLKHFALLTWSIIIMTAAAAGSVQASDPENTILMEVDSGGTVTIELRPDLAPQHAERIKTLTREGFYDGIVFHRVIEGFMAQTGDPTGTGTGGSNYPDLPAEFSQEDYKRGTIGMARTADPNSANSQFFICFTDTGCSFLKGQYTVLGQVTDGMEYIDTLAKGEPPLKPSSIIKMQVAADAQGDNEASAPTAADPAGDADVESTATEPAAGAEEPVAPEQAQVPAAAEESAPAAAESPAAETKEPPAE